MDILKMLADLREERQHIEEAIMVIERLAAGTRAKRRGRPPKWMSVVTAGTASSEAPKTRTVSAAGRRRMAEAQRKRWAAKKSAEAV